MREYRMLENFHRSLPGRQFGFALAVVLILTMGIQRTDAQQTSGAVSGTVLDTQKHGIPGVEVVFISQDTSQSRTAFTDEHGFYRLPAVDPGPYSIAFSKSGFESSPQSGVAVNASEKTVDRVLRFLVADTSLPVTDPGGE